MAQPLVSDELWEIVEPLIPKVKRRYRYPGRRRIDDRKVLTGILFVLKTGVPWEQLPQDACLLTAARTSRVLCLSDSDITDIPDTRIA